MRKQILKLFLISSFSPSAFLLWGFNCKSTDFDSPIKLAYDFSPPDLEALVMAENENNALNEIAAIDLPVIELIQR